MAEVAIVQAEQVAAETGKPGADSVQELAAEAAILGLAAEPEQMVQFGLVIG